MVDKIVWLWNASPVNPLTVAVIGWVVWKLYSAVGAKIFFTLVTIAAGLAVFWDAERVQQILTWLCGAYVALNLLGFAGGGGGSMPSFAASPSIDPEPSQKKSDEPFIPEGAPYGFDPSIQPHGAHRYGYDRNLDPAYNNRLC
ncbi:MULTISPECIES: hypothetical protein [unclassified Sphingomonas]|uniref:hypothetical protein n=1 Tax=Sphingomonas sp. PvP015 TaxID=3156388 RepID=UPI0033925275